MPKTGCWLAIALLFAGCTSHDGGPSDGAQSRPSGAEPDGRSRPPLAELSVDHATVAKAGVDCRACHGDEGSDRHVVLLPYAAFGPQAAAYPLVGMEWWQWDGPGDSDPAAAAPPIRIVVHRGLDEETLHRGFPVDEARSLDHRYVTYADALAHLDAVVREDLVPSVTERARQTRARLRRAFERE